jgi:predicted nucleic-acid-binding protein
MPKPQPLTRAHLDAKLEAVARVLHKLVAFRDVAATKGDVREAVQHFNKRFDAIEERLDAVDVQLEAIKESLTFRREFTNLVRELKAQGIRLDERRIFVG